MGDFNGRVGRRRDPWTAYLGPHSDRSTECNYNGHQLLSLCAEYDLVITNTLFQHRSSHTQTWYRWSDMTVSSQIDFILTRASRRTSVQDARAIPNAGLDTDHRPVLMYMRGKGNGSHRRKLPHEPQINTHKLRKNMDIQEEIKQRVTERLKQEDTWDKSAEETWSIFKNTLLDCLMSKCGKKKNGRGQRKATKWWNDEVKEAVREKKRLYKVWVKSQTQEDYVNYRLARRQSKREVKHAKDASWKTYGHELSELCKRSPREFYRSVRAMRLRDEPYNPTPVINDQDGNPIYEEDKIKLRWEQYFRDLLNPVDENRSHIQFNPSYPEHTEPNTLEEEVRRAVKTSPKNKAAGVDGIPVEVITACGKTGIRWLTTIFQKVWAEQCVPEDWRKSVVIPIWKKKGNKKECSTYRGISLISHTGKIFAKILEQRTRAIVDPLLSEAQFGFRKGTDGVTPAENKTVFESLMYELRHQASEVAVYSDYFEGRLEPMLRENFATSQLPGFQQRLKKWTNNNCEASTTS
ncbi:uncharacterized protein LOC118418267 [Branchiostoma floridae]|uniref:Uncharacterized protein LOC118418267 n=1 Tax=Branchiostoma floridae TaxID=7739 RepID=A0A9J7LC58_BRAFL|nr:uncharacterized protein LOC118418267 [Branchiostoma floridae]